MSQLWKVREKRRYICSEQHSVKYGETQKIQNNTSGLILNESLYSRPDTIELAVCSIF